MRKPESTSRCVEFEEYRALVIEACRLINMQCTDSTLDAAAGHKLRKRRYQLTSWYSCSEIRATRTANVEAVETPILPTSWH